MKQSAMKFSIFECTDQRNETFYELHVSFGGSFIEKIFHSAYDAMSYINRMNRREKIDSLNNVLSYEIIAEPILDYDMNEIA